MLKIFKRFYRFLFKYKWTFGAFLLLTVISTGLENIGPYFYKILIDNISGKNYQFLLKILALFVGARIVGNLLNSLTFYLGDKVVLPASKDARLLIFKQVQNLDFAFHVSKNTGSLISAFKRGDGAFWDIFESFHNDILRTLISLVIVLLFFSGVSPLILWLMVGLFAFNLSLSWFLVKINLKRRKVFNTVEDRLSGIITDNLINYETVKFFAQEEKEQRRLGDKFVQWSDRLWKYILSFRLMDIVVGTLSGLGMFLVLWVVIVKVIRNEISVGSFVMVTSFITGFYYRFFGLLYQIRRIARSLVDIEKYFAILNNEILVKDPKNPKTIKDFQGNIEFNQVSFFYPKDKKPALDKINLNIKPGESVAFVGRSGAGKTTIIRLILRFYDPTKGKIFISGVDIKKLNKSYLRSFIGVVPQEPVLFNNTIGFNIGYGGENIKKSKIVAAAKMANLHDFISQLPKRYKTQVGERGIKLSGGQKQRLAIARALLADPKIIVFDEATSNLDSESEGLVQDALWKTAKGKTVLIIAHRFSTIRKAKRIIVIEKGSLVETGSHKQLMRKKEGVYRHLWLLQQKGQLEKDEGGLLSKDRVSAPFLHQN